MVENNTKVWVNSYLDLKKNIIIHYLHKFFHGYFYKFIKDKDMKILDVGCGDGGFLKTIYLKGYKNIYGIEPNELLINVSKGSELETIRKNIRYGYADNIPFGDESFDCITFFNVIHHLKNKESYLKTIDEVDRCLKKNGYVIIVEPCNRLIYSFKRFIITCFKKISQKCLNIYNMMMEEKDDVRYFFNNSYLFREEFIKRNYKVHYDKKLFHQWVFILQNREAQ